MKITLLREDVKLPTKSHELDCGLDLYLLDNIKINPFQTVCLDTGLAVDIPEGYAGILAPRSSIAKRGILVHAAIIDPGYKGEIHIIATNCNLEPVEFSKGDRLCSLVCYNILNPIINPEDNRGSSGLGGSGR